MKFAFIQEHLRQFPAEAACEALEVSRSGYYAWVARPPCARARRSQELVKKIEAAHEENRRVYGSPRIFQVLADQGVQVCRNTVARLMKQQGIAAKTKRKPRAKKRARTSSKAVRPARPANKKARAPKRARR